MPHRAAEATLLSLRAQANGNKRDDDTQKPPADASSRAASTAVDASSVLGRSLPSATLSPRLSPTEIDTYAQWAWLSGRTGEAIELYTDLSRLSRRAPHVHFKLGFLYLSQHDYSAAIQHFTEEINRYSADLDDDSNPEQKPNRSPTRATSNASTVSQHRVFVFCAYAGRSEAYDALQESRKADMDRLFIANRSGNTKSYLLAMGCLYFRFGMLQRADDCLERCAAVDPKDPAYLIEHAELRLAQHRYPAAAGMFEKCRNLSASTSPIYQRALIGEGAALMRQNKLQDAVIVLLQALNNLRNTIRSAQATAASKSPQKDSASQKSTDDVVIELVQLYHQATNLYGGLCLMKGELKSALDTFHAVAHRSAVFTEIVPFRLPNMCITPGTKDEFGELVDSTKVSTRNLSELVRHLNELEWRYGPDACTYFHRANVYRAMGDLAGFVDDLSLVESLDPSFLKTYLLRDCFGDFLDVETITWIPLYLVDAVHMALDRNEYQIPASTNEKPATMASPSGTSPPKKPGKTTTTTAQAMKTRPAFSEAVILRYFQERIKHNRSLDEFAQVFQIDIYRRLPEAKWRRGPQCRLDVLPWEGVALDEDGPSFNETVVNRDPPLRELIKPIVANHGRHPCAHMLAGAIELDMFNASVAHLHFTEAISIIERQAYATSQAKDSSSLAQRWQQQVYDRAKFYCLIWRSMSSRMNTEMEKAVEDLNLAAAVNLDDNLMGSDDPLLLVQRALIMFLNGHLKSAYKLLRQLKRKTRFSVWQTKGSAGVERADIIDMLANVGLNSFRLLPPQVEREILRLSSATSQARQPRPNVSDFDQDWEAREEKEEEDAAMAIVKYALSKKTAGHTETHDKFYEAGTLKLSSTGDISQAIPFFQAILSMDDSYLPPTNFASLELFKCKEEEFAEEKLFNCFVRLGKRSKWLQKKIKWRFEALIDANLAHAYLPTDMETLWHRSRLLKEQRNYVSAISDLTDCIQLMAAQATSDRGRSDKLVFPNEAKKTQWLQLLLERGMLFMQISDWDKAMDDFTAVITQAGKKHQLLETSALESRSSCMIRLKRFGHALQDLQRIIAMSQSAKASKTKGPATDEDARKREDLMLNCILVGNLYCQLALDQMKASSALTQRNTALTPSILRQLRAMHINMGFIGRAAAAYDDAHKAAPGYFLVHYFVGRMHAITGQSRKAIQSLTDCLRLHAMFLPALFLRGCIYAQENLFVLALADFYRVRHRVADYPHLNTSIGYCHLQRGSMVKAVETFTEAVEQNADDVEAYYMRGCVLQELLILPSAVKDFERVAAKQPTHFRAHYQLAVCHVLLRQYVAAYTAMQHVVRLQPEWRDAWILYGYCCFCGRYFDEAVHAYGRAIGLRDDRLDHGRETATHRDSTLFFYRAVANIHANKFTEALADLELALRRNNENYVAFLAKAYCLKRQGEDDRAAEVLAHCLRFHKQVHLLPADELFDPREGRRRASTKRASLKDDGTTVVPAMTSAIVSTIDRPSELHDTQTTKIVTASVLFRLRKEMRDADSNQATPATQAAQDLRESSDRRLTFVDVDSQAQKRQVRRFSSLSPDARRTDDVDPLQRLQARAALRAKLLRVMKKLRFQYRVLKALEQSTSAKYKKSQRLTRLLAEILQPATNVAWPKGTLSSKLLLWGFNTLGVAQLQQLKVDDALMSFTLAIQASPSEPVALLNRGNVYLRMNVLPSAISGFQDVLDANEQYYQAHNNIGVAYFALKRLGEAQEAFSTGLHHAQDDQHRAVLLYNLGVTFQALDKADEALDFYQQAIALDGSRTEFFNNRSAILHHQMRFAVALEDYNRALALQAAEASSGSDLERKLLDTSDALDVRINRAQLYIAMGHCTLATRDLHVVRTALLALPDSGDGVSPSESTAGRPRTFETDMALVNDLLSFCEKWKAALRIATKDFLFALHAFPCFATFQLFPLFMQELEHSGDEGASQDAPDNQASSSDGVVTPLPINDVSFFDFERDFAPSGKSDEPHGSPHVSKAVASAIEEQRRRPYAEELDQVLELVHRQHWDDAARQLLRAHYKTSLDSHDEYLLMAWRVQLALRAAEEIGDEQHPDALQRATSMLSEFLHDRRTPREIAMDRLFDDDTVGSNQPKTGSQLRAALHTGLDFEDIDDDHDTSPEWRQQRRVIRADLYHLLGGLYQLHGQPEDARRCFLKVLRLRNDHATALLNVLQLSFVAGEYESALDCVLKLLDMFLCFANPEKASVGSPVGLSNARGLLNADRSLKTLLPAIETAFQEPGVVDIGWQMLTVLKDYRAMLSSQIQANTSHIFKKQGAIARLVQQLLSMSARQEQQYHDSSVTFGLDWQSFNQTLDSYRDHVLQAPSTFADSADFAVFLDAFHSQFSQVCDQVGTHCIVWTVT
ncbi:hypothetical protein ATCC90586_007243 [Pythium insidiosum]|nr:hypothetical protein ATCC90586_007243 [Pythium insidiosum]